MKRLRTYLKLRRIVIEIDIISITVLVKRQAKDRIEFGVSYLDCFMIKLFE